MLNIKMSTKGASF